ncbi:MAG: CDP-diacylglycerol--glycerol-3-phosphate 3-phosphatidyltransferase [Jiangellales bacterium]
MPGQEPEPSAWNLPNALTTLRLVLVPLFAWLLLREDGTDPASRIGAVVVFVLAMITDYVDGKIARERGLVTSFGKIVDPIADKALIGTALIGLSILGQVPWWVTGIILLREIGVTLLRFVVIRHGVMPAGRGGKTKTVLQTITLVLLMLPLPDSWSWLTTSLLAATVVVTVATGVDYVASAVTMRRTSERTAAKRAARSSTPPPTS